MPWRGTEPGGGQDPADRPLAHPVPQAQQLTLDAPVAPTRVLPRQLLHKSADLDRDWRTSGRVWVGPFLLDRAPVPGQQGAQGHHLVQAQVPGQQPGQGGEHCTVSPVWPQPGQMPAQYPDLVPQHKDLRVFGGVTARQEDLPAEQPNHEEIDKADEHERRA